jgi:NitT/TauT family transport system substrate-binding protein
MRKLYLIIVILSLFISCKSAEHQESTLRRVNVAQYGKAKFLLYLPLYVAMEEGLFKERGLDVNLIFAGNDDQIFATVLSGEADFGVGDPVFTSIAAEKGIKAKTVAMMITNLGLTGYTNRPEVPVIKKPSDLKGLRVGSLPEPSTTFTLLSELKRKNLELSTMEIVQGAFGTHLAMLEAGKVDIAVDLEPTVSEVEEKGYRVVFPMTPFIEKQAITGLTTTEDTINKNPTLVSDVVYSMQEAMILIHRDRDVSYRTAKKLFPNLSEKVVKNAVDRMMRDAMYPESIVVDDILWQRTLKTRLDSGELKSPQETSHAVDNKFAEEAWENLNKK